MWQTLFLIPEKVGNLPVFGLGLLFGIWLVFSVGLLAWLIWRQGFNSETQSYLPILLMLGVGIVFLAPLMIKPESGGLPIRGYGVMVTLGVISGVGLSAWQARRMGLDPEIIFSLAFWMFLFGIGGARFYFVINHWADYYEPDNLRGTLWNIINLTNGGLVVYGSVMGGLAAWFVFCQVRKLPLLAIGDLIAPGMLLGLAFGRIGCLFNGCCYGGVCESPSLPSITFPHFASVKEGKPSDPYIKQLGLGLLRGFRLGANKQGEAEVQSVMPGTPAAMSGLAVGDVVRRIELDPNPSLFAALTVPDLAGHELEIETESGGQISVPITPRPKGGKRDATPNIVGFELSPFDAPGGVVVTSVTADGPADRAGLKPNDRLKSIHLPLVPSAKAAEQVLRHAEKTVVLETTDGKRHDVSLTELPLRSLPVHPTQIYSSIKAALLALFLWSFYPFRRRDGEVFAWMLTLYPLFRILLEAIRDDEPGIWGTSITGAQAWSSVILLIGLALWAYLFTRPRGSVLPPATSP